MATELHGSPRRASCRPRIPRGRVLCKIALVQVKNSAWFIIIMCVLLPISRIHIIIFIVRLSRSLSASVAPIVCVCIYI